MNADELRVKLQSGRTIAGVAAGTHTRAEADQKAADAAARIEAMINGEMPTGRGPGGGPR